MGMTPQQTADQVFETAMGGVDLCKDDEMTSDTCNMDEIGEVIRNADPTAAIAMLRKAMGMSGGRYRI